MNPLDALNPKISDEELVISYAESITDLVTDDYTVSDVIHDDRIWSHQWFTDLLLLIFEGYDECLEDWDLATKIVRELQEKVKRLHHVEGILDDYRAFHTWIGEKNYDLIAEWDKMESEKE